MKALRKIGMILSIFVFLIFANPALADDKYELRIRNWDRFTIKYILYWVNHPYAHSQKEPFPVMQGILKAGEQKIVNVTRGDKEDKYLLVTSKLDSSGKANNLVFTIKKNVKKAQMGYDSMIYRFR